MIRDCRVCHPSLSLFLSLSPGVSRDCGYGKQRGFQEGQSLVVGQRGATTSIHVYLIASNYDLRPQSSAFVFVRYEPRRHVNNSLARAAVGEKHTSIATQVHLSRLFSYYSLSSLCLFIFPYFCSLSSYPPFSYLVIGVTYLV